MKERYKDTWELLPKEHRESILKLQNAVTSGDLKHLKEWAKGLDSEVAEKMAKVVDKNLQDAGSKVHVKSADGRSLVYGNGSAEGVLIGNDGKARVVAMKAEEVNNTARILDGETPFKSVTTLAKELADSAVRNIKKQELNKQK